MTDEENLDADSEFGFTPAVSDSALSPARAAASRGTGRAGASQPAASQPAASSPGAVRRGSRRAGLRRKATGLAVLVGALTAVGGGYALLAPSSTAAGTVSSAADIEQGRQLYQTSCITCHGANLDGVSGRGPSIVGSGSADVYFQVGTGRMPAVAQGAVNERKTPRFTESQTLQIAAYVQSRGGGPEVPAPGTDLRAENSKIADGGELFRLNCASCHGATGHGAPLSAGKIAPPLGEATDPQIYTAMLVGPESMPIFSNNQITPEQKREIIAYVQFLKESKDPGGAGIGRIGPVAEGFVIWTVGLGVLMVSILWIGARL